MYYLFCVVSVQIERSLSIKEINSFDKNLPVFENLRELQLTWSARIHDWEEFTTTEFTTTEFDGLNNIGLYKSMVCQYFDLYIVLSIISQASFAVIAWNFFSRSSSSTF